VSIMRCVVIAIATLLLVAPAAADDVNSPVLTYSPWTKICLQDTCFIGKTSHFDDDCGPVVAVSLIERSGDMKTELRISLRTRVDVEDDVRISIDQGEPIKRPFEGCYVNVGCMAQYLAGPELVQQLERGQMLVIEATDKPNSTIRFTVPLADFADAYNGPSQPPPKVFEEVRSAKEIQAMIEQQKRAEEERKSRCQSRY
jgi:invasion protein IalB